MAIYRHSVRLIDLRTPNVTIEHWPVWVTLEIEADEDGGADVCCHTDLAPSRGMMEESADIEPCIPDEHRGFTVSADDYVGDLIPPSHISRYVSGEAEAACEDHAELCWLETCDEVTP